MAATVKRGIAICVDFFYVPVFGSIGDKQKAMAACRMMNVDGKVRYV